MKPENVMYVDEQRKRIVLIDFGFAKAGIRASSSGASAGGWLSPRSSARAAKRRTLVGTLPYMAPELFEPVAGAKLRVGDRCVAYDMWL